MIGFLVLLLIAMWFSIGLPILCIYLKGVF